MNKTKTLDDKDIVFIDQPWTEEERKQFSLFLKARKIKKISLKKSRIKKHIAE